MMVPAPRSRAPAVAHSPIGPRAKITTISPILILAASAPAKPVDMMSGHISTCSSVSASGTGAKLAGHRAPARIRPECRRWYCRIASRPWACSHGRSSRHPERAGRPAGVGGEAGADGAGDHPLAFPVALHVAAQLFDDAHRFVTDGQAGSDRVFTLENVDVGAADGGRGDAQQRIVGTNLGDGLVLQFDAARLDEHGGFHHGHGATPLGSEDVRTL